MMVKACKIKTEDLGKVLLSSASLHPSLYSQNSSDNNIHMMEFLQGPNKLSVYLHCTKSDPSISSNRHGKCGKAGTEVAATVKARTSCCVIRVHRCLKPYLTQLFSNI